MKVLFWFCKNLKISNPHTSSKSKINDSSFDLIDEKDVLVPWITIESKSDGSVERFLQVLSDLNLMSSHFKTKNVVVVPFAHLSSQIAEQKTSFEIIGEFCSFLKEKGFVVKRANFGSHKDLEFSSPADEFQVFFRQYPKPDFK